MRTPSPLLLLLALLLAACGDDDGGGNLNNANNDNGNQVLPDAATPDAALPDAATPDAAPTSARPPEAGEPHPGDGAGATTFAVSRLYLGDTDPDGTPDAANGWKRFGYDVDGLQSTPQSVDLCRPRNGASTNQVYPDGDLGRDNGFGRSILPILMGLMTDLSQQANDAIVRGDGTLLITLDALGTGTDYNPLAARLYRAAPLGSTPFWDGTDAWSVAPELLQDPVDLATSTMAAPQSYLVGDTWVGPVQGTVLLRIQLSTARLELPIDQAVLSMELDAAHKTAARGVISGVLALDKLIPVFVDLFGAFDVSLRDPQSPTLQSIVAQIEQAADILRDGTQDPGQTCDAVSIGLGFDAEIAQIGGIADPEVVVDPCP